MHYIYIPYIHLKDTIPKRVVCPDTTQPSLGEITTYKVGNIIFFKDYELDTYYRASEVSKIVFKRVKIIE